MVARVSRFALLVSKFRGCTVGSLVGECFGRAHPASAAAALRPTLDDNHFQPGICTAILQCVGESLVERRDFDRQNLTSSLRKLHEEQAFNTPAIKGHGASASTAAVCVAPIVMYFYNDLSRAVQVSRESVALVSAIVRPQSQAEMTSAAVLHCLALQLAFQFDPIRPLNVDRFLDRLVSDVAEVEATVERSNRHSGEPLPTVIVDHDKPSLRRLECVRDMLRRDRKPHASLSEAVAILKGDVVSTAIYAFLLAQQQQQRNDDPKGGTAIERLLHQSSSLSMSEGDSTLPFLSCGLTGALLGIESVPHVLRRCHGLQETVKLGDKLAMQFEAQPSVYDRPEITFSQRL